VHALQLRFDRAVDPKTVTIGQGNSNTICDRSRYDEDAITLLVGLPGTLATCHHGTVVPIDDRTFTVRFARPIAEDREVRMHVSAKRVRDRRGQAMPRAFEGTFRTRQETRVMVHGVARDGRGGYVIAGAVFGALPGQQAHGRSDAFVARYDAAGRRQWVRQFGSAEHDQAEGLVVSRDGVVVTGFTDAALPGHRSAGGRDVLVRRYTLEGKQAWSHQYGKAGFDQAHAIAAAPDGSLYLTGRSNRSTPREIARKLPDAYDILVMKLAPSGAQRWARTFGGHKWGGSKYPAQIGLDVAADARGPVVVGSTYNDLHGQKNRGAPSAFVLALSPNGRAKWTRLTPWRTAFQSVLIHRGEVYAAGVGPTQKSGTFARFSRSGKRVVLQQHALGPDAALTTLVAHGKQLSLVGRGTRYDAPANQLYVDRVLHARVSRRGAVRGSIATGPIGRRGYVHDAVAGDGEQVCVAGSDDTLGFVRCFEPGASTPSLAFELEASDRHM
jgi:hypothetical protein